MRKALRTWIRVGWAGLYALPGLGQVVPPASGSIFHVPSMSGSLRYSVSASERVQFGYNGLNETSLSSVVSGNLAFLSDSPTRPFSLVYSGGYLGNTTGQASSFFQDLALSQVVDTKHWNFAVSDSLMYLPLTPSVGLSGLAGLGDLGVGEGAGSQDSLTSYAPRVNNQTSGTITRKLTASTEVEGTASYAIQRFLETSGGLNTNERDLSGGVNHRISDRKAISASYTYTSFAYPAYMAAIVSQGINVEYSYQVSRKLKVSAAAGPQRISASSLTGRGAAYNYTANALAAYAAEHTTYTASYIRMTNNGSGVTIGSRSDTANLMATRRLSQKLSAAVTATYTDTNSLSSLPAADLRTRGEILSAQVNRSLGEKLSGFLSYSLQRQSTQGSDLSGLALNGLTQVVGFGITYSPPPKRLVRH